MRKIWVQWGHSSPKLLGLPLIIVAIVSCSARHFQLFRCSLRRRRARLRGLVLGPRVPGEHVRHVQEGQRPGEDRRLVPHRSQAPPERHQNQRPGLFNSFKKLANP